MMTNDWQTIGIIGQIIHSSIRNTAASQRNGHTQEYYGLGLKLGTMFILRSNAQKYSLILYVESNIE